MKCIAFFVFFLPSLFVFIDATALPEDSLKKEIRLPTIIKYIDEHAFDSPEPKYHLLDTAIDCLQDVNPASKGHYNFLSNISSASSSQIFRNSPDLFTDVGFHTYDLYLFDEHKIRYFKTNKAYSEIEYHLAGGKEEQITVALTKNVFKTWNVGLNFNRLGSLGFMKNGSTFHNNIDLYSWVHSANRRYNLISFAMWNSMDNKVNGGILSDSLYDNSVVSNFELEGLQVNLNDAKNRFRNRQFSIRQFYDFMVNTDNNTSDTLQTNASKSTFRIGHSINLEERSFTYIDNNPGDYYENTFFNSTTLDSLHFYDLRNRISLALFDHSNEQQNPWKLSSYTLSWENQWLKYAQFAYDNIQFPDTIMQNNALSASLSNREDSVHVLYKLNGGYIFDGANKDNATGELSLTFPMKKFGTIGLSGQIYSKSPEFIYNRYFSNHFIRNSSTPFEKSKWKSAGIHYSLTTHHFSFGMEATSVVNFIFLDSAAAPAQAKSEINIFKYELKKDFIYRKFHFNNTFIMQHVNQEEFIHLPALISSQSLFYESYLYKKALQVQCGFDVHYSSLYYADAFMPATGMFNWQAETKTNGYARFDFFINFRIKSARFMIKFENIGDNIIENGYYLTPHYPMQGMTIKFGINWRFFDQ